MKQVTKRKSTQVTPTGEAILQAIRLAWLPVKYRREVVRLVDGKPEFVFEDTETPSPIRKLNADVDPAEIIRFANMVKPEDALRIQGLIVEGKLEVAKAIQAEQALDFAKDKKAQPKTWEEAIAAGAPSLATVAKYKGADKAADLVFLLLFGFVQKFGRRADISDDILQELAEDVVEQFRPLTIADLKVILNQGIKAKVFNLDYQTLFSMIDKGFDDKCEYAAGQSLYRHEQTRAARPDQQPGPTLSLAEQIAEVKLLYPKK